MPWPYRQPGRPAITGVYDALRGGHRHLEPARRLAGEIEARFPGTGDLFADERAFTRRAVTWAAGGGIRQYVVAGAGMPGAEGQNVHDVARRVIPGAAVAYVSADPYAIAYGRALLAGGTPGIAAVQADLRWPYAVMTHPGLTGLIDHGEASCVVLPLILHFAAPGQAPLIVRRFADWLAPGSCMIVSLLIPDESAEAAELMDLFGRAGTMYRHTAADVGGWLENEETRMELAAPEVVPVQAWPSGGWAAGQLARRPVAYAAGAVAVTRGLRPGAGDGAGRRGGHHGLRRRRSP